MRSFIYFYNCVLFFTLALFFSIHKKEKFAKILGEGGTQLPQPPSPSPVSTGLTLKYGPQQCYKKHWIWLLRLDTQSFGINIANVFSNEIHLILKNIWLNSLGNFDLDLSVHPSIYGRSCPELFYKISIFKNSAKFTGKYLCWSLFLIKLQAFISCFGYTGQRNTLMFFLQIVKWK